MTSKEAQAGIGRHVTEDAVCEVGELREVIYKAGGDGRGKEYLVRIQYPTGERVIPLSSAKWSRKGPEPIPHVRAGVHHQRFIDRMRSVSYSGPKQFQGTPKEYQDREDAIANVFAEVFGRKPTAAELFVMDGGAYPRCKRCGESVRSVFTPDGSVGLECKCTDALNSAFRGAL